MKSIFASTTFCMLIFFILLLSFADFFINILLFEQFFPKHHQIIKLFKNPDFVEMVQNVCKGYQQMTKVI